MEWAARAIGVFYVLGGLMLLYQAWLNWRLQQALSHLVSTSFNDQLADGVIALGGLMVLASGLALAALSSWAVIAFSAGWAIQAAYLLWANRSNLDDPPAAGRGAAAATSPAAGRQCRCRTARPGPTSAGD